MEKNIDELLEKETDEVLVAIREALKRSDKMLEEIKGGSENNG